MAVTTESEVRIKAKKAKMAAPQLAVLDTATKNRALKLMGEALLDRKSEIMEANRKDLEEGRSKGMSRALLDRLEQNDNRIKGMVEGLEQVVALPDPIGEILEEFTRPNGLKVKKIRVPMGVIAIVFESRPNVTVDSAGLCLKSGNVTILRGGSDAIHSNAAIVRVITEAANRAGVPENAIQLIENTDRGLVKELLTARGLIDLVIPRGGAGLIKMVVETATIPVIETGEGVCHTYIESTADPKMAEEIVFNAKTQRPSVCNAIETLLVDRSVAEKVLPPILKRLQGAGVEIRGDSIVQKLAQNVKPASEEDWKTEYLALILSVKTVGGVDEAIEHINTYGTKHSEAIITKNPAAEKKFREQVDASSVYVNASTRFTDGFEFGLGAEIGISTQKLHARGPMGLRELTSYKYLIEGTGQVRP